MYYMLELGVLAGSLVVFGVQRLCSAKRATVTVRHTFELVSYHPDIICKVDVLKS